MAKKDKTKIEDATEDTEVVEEIVDAAEGVQEDVAPEILD